jgi:hypothetical protein
MAKYAYAPLSIVSTVKVVDVFVSYHIPIFLPSINSLIVIVIVIYYSYD